MDIPPFDYVGVVPLLRYLLVALSPDFVLDEFHKKVVLWVALLSHLQFFRELVINRDILDDFHLGCYFFGLFEQTICLV